VQLDATYTTPDQAHAMMEPHASIAAWDGDKLTLWTSNQMIAWTTGDVAKTLGIPKENVRLLSPFVGGGFGSKLGIHSETILAAIAARVLNQPVKIAMTRQQIFHPRHQQHRHLHVSHSGAVVEAVFAVEAAGGDPPMKLSGHPAQHVVRDVAQLPGDQISLPLEHSQQSCALVPMVSSFGDLEAHAVRGAAAVVHASHPAG